MTRIHPRNESAPESPVRATISFPSEMYQTLEGIAREKKVSLAWVVREAVDQYVSDKWPLFGKTHSEEKP